MSNWRKFFCISLILSLTNDGHLLESATSKLTEEGYCDLLPSCVCMNMPGRLVNRSKLVCEKEINVEASAGFYLHPVRFLTKFLVFCNSDVSPNVFNRDYYTLLNLENLPPHIDILFVNSCPEPPIPYFSLISPSFQSSIESQSNRSNITIHLFKITCDSYNVRFSLQRNHLIGLKTLKRLFISCQSLFDIPADLFYDTTTSLQEMIISSTQVVSIHVDTFSNLSNLKELSLNNNLIRTISNGTFNNLISLRKLDLSDNTLITLSSDIFYGLSNLIYLNLSKNSISSMPRSTRNLSNLTVLDISYNSLDQITVIEGLDKLEKLFLNHNNLTYLNASVLASLKSIEGIDLSGNAIVNLAVIPFPLNELYKFVFIDNSQPKFYMEPFLAGNSIEELIFSNSSVVSINPEFLEKIPRLKRIYLSKNKLTSIPAGLFSKNVILHKILLNENNISELPADIFSDNPELETLDISSNTINSLPDTIFENNHQLKFLDVSQNQLTLLSNNWFHNKTLLTHLFLADNKLTFIHPLLLNTNIEIEELDFSGNMLDNIPKEIFMSFKEQLFHLDLARNRISSLPLLDLPRLRSLNLSHNSLENLQEGLFKNLSSLESLDLSYNHIKNLSNSHLLSEDLRMKLLDLSNNHLSYIPEEMLKNKNIYIDSINFSGNSMTSFYVDRLGRVKELIELHVANNNISYFGIDPDIEFWDLFPTIKLLDLSSNNLDFKEARWFYDDQKSTWGKVTRLILFPNAEVILLSNNSISKIFLDWRDDLHKLRLLDLRYNRIRQLHHQDIMFTSPNAPHIFPVKNRLPERILHPRLNNTDPPPAPPAPLIVDLRGNLIRTVDIPLKKVKPILLDRNGTVPEGIYGHATILLDDNPFICDCKMLYFLRIVQNDVAPVSDLMSLTGKDWVMPARIEVGNLSCWEPKSVRGSQIAEPETWMHHILPLISLCSLWRE